MAFTGSPTGSVQYNLETGVTAGGAYGGEVAGQLHCSIFEYTHSAAAGAGTGEINLLILPPGAIIVLPLLSAWGVSVVWVATSTISIGNRAFTQPNGVVVAQSAITFVSAGAVGAAQIPATAFALPAFGQIQRFNSQGPGVTIFGTVATANITVGGTLFGWVTWADPS